MLKTRKDLTMAIIGITCVSMAGCGPQITIQGTTGAGGAGGGDSASVSSSSSSGAMGGMGGLGGMGGSASSSGGGATDCVTPADCVVEVPECRKVKDCVAGKCIFDEMPQGTPLSVQTSGDCTRTVCDGLGSQTDIPQDDDIEDDGHVCTIDTCQDMIPMHQLVSEIPCYDGPITTQGVGACKAGLQACDSQGNGVGDCIGEVLPQTEVCDLTGVDENCDGVINESSAGCVCGDGIVTYGEACDDGNADPQDSCTPLCQPPQCGDGYVQPALGEECDDGATSDADACSSTCQKQYALQLTAGSGHSCAILAHGRVKCWGWNGSGQLGIGNMDPHGIPPNSMGQNLPAIDLGTGRTATAISAGYGHNCALLDNGMVKCWGANNWGQLGLGDTNPRGDEPGEMGDALPPVDLGTGRTALQIGTGSNSTCALLDDGMVKCWGYNGSGQLGLGDKRTRGDESGEMGDNLPAIDFGTGKTVVSMGIGTVHGCAILSDGKLKCWGANYTGALGIGDVIPRGDNPNEMGDNLPAVDLGMVAPLQKVDPGYQHTCALFVDGTMKCWGTNAGGVLGLGDSITRGDQPFEMGNNLPKVDLGTGKTAVSIETAETHTCVVLNDATVRCWGDGTYGRLGHEDVNSYGYAPNQMGDNLPATKLGTGKMAVAVVGLEKHSCALFVDGSIKCWGDNGSGQCGFANPSIAGSQPGTMGDLLKTVKLYSSQW